MNVLLLGLAMVFAFNTGSAMESDAPRVVTRLSAAAAVGLFVSGVFG